MGHRALWPKRVNQKSLLSGTVADESWRVIVRGDRRPKRDNAADQTGTTRVFGLASPPACNQATERVHRISDPQSSSGLLRLRQLSGMYISTERLSQNSPFHFSDLTYSQFRDNQPEYGRI